MYFPTAGIETSPFIPPLVALAVSFFTSMGGLSGAFLLLPFQMSVLGYTNPSVSATNQLYNVFANPGGVFRYWRENRLLWPLAWIVAAGSVPGVMAGAVIRVQWLPDSHDFKLFAALVMLAVGLEMIRSLISPPAPSAGISVSGTICMPPGFDSPPDITPPDPVSTTSSASTSSAATASASIPADSPSSGLRVLEQTRRRVVYSHGGQCYAFSVPRLWILSVLVGLVGGVYGIGGGAVISPILVSLFRLPVHTVAGATLLSTCLTSVAGVVFYMFLAPWYPHLVVSPDWSMALLLGAGGFVGMYGGARCQKYVSSVPIKWMLVLVLVFTAILYFFEFFTLSA